MDEQRSLLDSLMGIHRDADNREREKRAGESFKDSKVCKYFLVGFCPNELFKNTKRELGPCQFLHNDHVQQEFEDHPEAEELRRKYEQRLRAFLEDIVREADRWIEREKRNAQKPVEVPNVDALLTEEEKEQIEKLNQAAADLIARSEKDAEEGNFAASEQKTAHAMQAKASAESLKERRLQAYVKREEMGSICDVCGIRTEVGSEVAPHENGKVHTGYLKARAKIAELAENEKKYQAKRSGRERDRDRSLGRRDRDRERDRRGGDRDRRDRERSRDRRSRDKRSRSRVRGKRDRDEKKDDRRSTSARNRSKAKSEKQGESSDMLKDDDDKSVGKKDDEDKSGKKDDKKRDSSEGKDRSRSRTRDRRRSRERKRSRSRSRARRGDRSRDRRRGRSHDRRRR